MIICLSVCVVGAGVGVAGVVVADVVVAGVVGAAGFCNYCCCCCLVQLLRCQMR